MLKTGILNPAINSLLSRVRHTNLLVIADRGFPFWRGVEIVDISLVDDIPTVKDVLQAILPNFGVAKAWMARQYIEVNDVSQQAIPRLLPSVEFIGHDELKSMVPTAVGLIRTADTTQYANIILESV